MNKIPGFSINAKHNANVDRQRWPILNPSNSEIWLFSFLLPFIPSNVVSAAGNSLSKWMKPETAFEATMIKPEPCFFLILFFSSLSDIHLGCCQVTGHIWAERGRRREKAGTPCLKSTNTGEHHHQKWPGHLTWEPCGTRSPVTGLLYTGHDTKSCTYNRLISRCQDRKMVYHFQTKIISQQKSFHWRITSVQPWKPLTLVSTK